MSSFQGGASEVDAIFTSLFRTVPGRSAGRFEPWYFAKLAACLTRQVRPPSPALTAPFFLPPSETHRRDWRYHFWEMAKSSLPSSRTNSLGGGVVPIPPLPVISAASLYKEPTLPRLGIADCELKGTQQRRWLSNLPEVSRARARDFAHFAIEA